MVCGSIVEELFCCAVEVGDELDSTLGTGTEGCCAGVASTLGDGTSVGEVVGAVVVFGANISANFFKAL